MIVLTGHILRLAGVIFLAAGIFLSLRDLAAIYSNALNSPLDEPVSRSGQAGELAISNDLWRYITLGAIGVPLYLSGAVIVRTCKSRSNS